MENRVAGWLHRLHRERDNARARLNNCRAELQRFEGYADPETDHDAVMLSKLQRDVESAERDAAYAALQLEDALEAEGLSL